MASAKKKTVVASTERVRLKVAPGRIARVVRVDPANGMVGVRIRGRDEVAEIDRAAAAQERDKRERESELKAARKRLRAERIKAHEDVVKALAEGNPRVARARWDAFLVLRMSFPDGMWAENWLRLIIDECETLESVLVHNNLIADGF